MSTNLNHPSDDKDRFYGLLENPRISLLQRLLLDGGRCIGLKYYLQKIGRAHVSTPVTL